MADMRPADWGSEKASVLAATSTWNALSMGHTLGGRDRCPEMGSTREARSWGSTSLGTKGYKKKSEFTPKHGKPRLGEGPWVSVRCQCRELDRVGFAGMTSQKAVADVCMESGVEA